MKSELKYKIKLKNNEMIQKRKCSHRTSSPNRCLVSGLFIVTGGLLLARNFGWITSDLFSIFVSWQMLLIVLGTYAVLTRHFFSGLILLIIGVGFMLPKLGLAWMPHNPGLTIIWPSILIIIGLLIVLRPRKKTINRSDVGQYADIKQQCHSSNGVLRSDNVFGGVHHLILDEIFKGGVIHNTFGGTTIDLRRTKLEAGETYIDVDNNWGGIELYVPSEWNVVIRCNAFMGACEDKRWRKGAVDTNCSLVIRGSVSFGGIEIKD